MTWFRNLKSAAVCLTSTSTQLRFVVLLLGVDANDSDEKAD